MKMKSLAMLAMSGLLAASFAYVAPAMADDMSNSGQSTQAPSDNTQNNVGATPSDNSMGGNSNSNTGNTGSTDEGSPDTATGDDDY
jgi:hypothetical protein